MNVPQNIPLSNLLQTKGIQWSPPVNTSRSTDVQDSIDTLAQAIRADLNRLRQCHQVLMASNNFGKHYKETQANQSEHYQNISDQLKKALALPPSQEVLNDLQELADALELDKSYMDTLFLQVAYRAAYLHFLMSGVVAAIGFEDLRSQAEMALREMSVLSGELSHQSSREGQLLKAQTALHLFVVFDELCRYEASIRALKEENDTRAAHTNKRVLGVTLGFFVVVLLSTIAMTYFGDSWKTAKDYRIIGVPIGVFLWSLIGSFAAIISQYYKNPVYEFGNTFKWVFIRPVLGVLMAAGIYLALYALVIDEQSTTSDLLPLLVAFFVGFSDSFSLNLIGSIQNVITSLFGNKANEGIPAPSPVVAVPPVAPLQQPATPIVAPPSDATIIDDVTEHIPPHPSNVPIATKPNGDQFAGEDES